LSWEINKENVHIVLRDNASNMARAMKDADLCSYVLKGDFKLKDVFKVAFRCMF